MIGIVQEFYNVTEGDGTVVICVAIISPLDLSLLLTDYQANLTFSLLGMSAEGIYNYSNSNNHMCIHMFLSICSSVLKLHL